MEPVMKVFAIENGFLLQHCQAEGVVLTTTYAKDAVGIAEEIIAQQARIKLDIPAQQEMFTPAQMGHKLKETNDE
jgi:hypothetical protein|tara:strand:- start:13223 stop:13447 length:225 start_codon:yes stop_codon:yes gene_type:complete